MPQIYWNIERPEPFQLSVDFAAGVAGVIDTTLGTDDVPKMKLPAAGAAIDGFAIRGGTAGNVADFATEMQKFAVAKAGATFGLGIELAVAADGEVLTATTGQNVVAKSVQAATTVGQLVTVRRVAPYLKA